MSLYRYVSNNPVVMIDYTGTQADSGVDFGGSHSNGGLFSRATVAVKTKDGFINGSVGIDTDYHLIGKRGNQTVFENDHAVFVFYSGQNATKVSWIQYYYWTVKTWSRFGAQANSVLLNFPRFPIGGGTSGPSTTDLAKPVFTNDGGVGNNPAYTASGLGRADAGLSWIVDAPTVASNVTKALRDAFLANAEFRDALLRLEISDYFIDYAVVVCDGVNKAFARVAWHDWAYWDKGQEESINANTMKDSYIMDGVPSSDLGEWFPAIQTKLQTDFGFRVVPYT
jgi:hypothetical protein